VVVILSESALKNLKSIVMEDNKMRKHVTAVATIRITLGMLCLTGILIGWLVFDFGLGFLESLLPSDEIPEIAITIIHFIVGFSVTVAGSISILGILGGIGLLTFQSWARVLTIIVSAISCLNIPFGTLIGVYSIWVLAQDETKMLFRR
jgi:hypothetical protein